MARDSAAKIRWRAAMTLERTPGRWPLMVRGLRAISQMAKGILTRVRTRMARGRICTRRAKTATTRALVSIRASRKAYTRRALRKALTTRVTTTREAMIRVATTRVATIRVATTRVATTRAVTTRA